MGKMKSECQWNAGVCQTGTGPLDLPQMMTSTVLSTLWWHAEWHI